ncbi:MAG TPA: 3-phosphoshikimate 1-carboxyvinyltransferase, partial [Usitatibacter sp.]|nr:3-phosphoshikimate 1-carboxyvinyltransferase [Usitatibacter sp.]
NRTLLMAALARGATELTSLLDSDDTRVMRDALKALGVPLEQRGSVEHVVVHGIGRASGFPNKKADLFLGNAGTAFRPLTAALALADGHYVLSGVPRMHERPIGDLVDALAQAGAQIEYRGAHGFPPLAVGPRRASDATTVRVRGNVSSQFLSATLIALAWTGRRSRIEVEGELISKPYVELTLGLMKKFGVEVRREDWRAFEIAEGEGFVSPGTLDVEGDASSASYFLAAGALGGGPVRVEGVGLSSLQGDVDFAHVLEQMGASITMGGNWIESRRVVAKHRQNPMTLKPFDLDFNLIPDAAMTAAVLALFATGPSRLRNIASWRVKETDRIAAMATELRKFGAVVEEGPDSLSITPPASRADTGAMVAVDTYDDHRMAMCFSLASFGPRRVRINEPGCVSKTFPAYFDEFRRLVS